MGVKVTNNAFGTLSAAINTTATTITLDSGQGSRFPTLGSGDYFFGTLVDTSNNLEIVKVTARSTDSLTVVRGQDGTSGTAFAIGDRFELRPVAALFEDIIDNASVDGITSASSSGVAMSITSGNDVGFNTSAPSPAQVAIQTGGGGQGVMLARNASGTSPTSGQEFGAFGWKGIMDGANTLNAAEAKIVALATENHSGTAAGTRMEFFTKPDGTGPGSAPTEAMRITEAGEIQQFKQPSFYAYPSVATVNTPVSAWTTLAFNTVGWNIGSHYNTSNYRWTVPVAGMYLINWMLQLENTNEPVWIYAYPIVNGSRSTDRTKGKSFSDFKVTPTYHTEAGSWIMKLAANDYVTFDIHTNSANKAFKGESHWSGILLG